MNSKILQFFRDDEDIDPSFVRLTRNILFFVIAVNIALLPLVTGLIGEGSRNPRAFLALGRGSVGSGRLRSEAFTPENLERQLAEVAAECVNHAQCVNVDRTASRLLVSSIFSWRSADFSAAYADRAGAAFSSRSPIERAVLAFIEPRLTSIEKDFMARNEFKVEFEKFDWSLNDLTGRGGR